MLKSKIAMAMAAAMVLVALYGCSSSSGIKNDRDEAITERDAALDAQAAAEERATTAEAARMTAEDAQDAAETAKMTAEDAQDAAETAKMTAEDAQDAAETAKMTAEDAQDAAETAKMTAEDAQDAAETAQGLAEGERDAAVIEQGLAEGERDAAVIEQGLAEDERDAAVIEQGLAEDERDAAVIEQGLAEDERDAAVIEQGLAEDERDAAVIEQGLAEDKLAAALISVSYAQAYGEYLTANGLYNSALLAYGAMDADVDEATMLVSAADKAMTEAQEAVAAATNGTTDEQREASDAVTVAMTAVENANNELTQAKTTMSSMPYAMAIQTQDAMEGMDGTATATRTGNAVTVTVMRGMSEVAKNAATRSIGNGWYKAAEVGETGDTATVYTDIENTMEKFSMVYIPVLSDGVRGVATGVLELETDADGGLQVFNAIAMASLFPMPSQGTVTVLYGNDDMDEDTTENPGSFDGTWNGVPGKFGCTGDVCSVTANTETITAMVGMWTFTPAYLGADGMLDAEDAMEPDDLPEPSVAVPDDDYLRFGWWTTVDEDDGSVTFRTFYGGAEAYTNSGFADLEGEAKYVGPAAGRYAAKTFNTNASLDSIRHGEFTATATLTARFGGGDIAENEADQIEGMIDGFMDENGRELAGWSVMLKPIGTQALSDGGGPISGAEQLVGENGGVGGGVGGSPVTSGVWEAQFFGSPAEAGMASADQPGSVAGKFDAHSSHGHVGGAFGAEKQ